jgi:hypothetical protein
MIEGFPAPAYECAQNETVRHKKTDASNPDERFISLRRELAIDESCGCPVARMIEKAKERLLDSIKFSYALHRLSTEFLTDLQ